MNNKKNTVKSSLILRGRMPLFFLVTAYWCKLKLPAMVMVGIVSACMIPVLTRQKRREDHRRKKLEEGAFYMEQLIYSFRRHHKIPAALRDVSRITEGELKRHVTEAAERLECDFEEDNPFQKAFVHIEAEYGHHLMHVLHTFLIRVEEQGGDCSLALELLLNQLRDWKKNQKAFAERKKRIQSRLVLAVILSCLICLAVVRMMPSASDVADLPSYQICTGAGLVIFQVLYIIFSTMSAGADPEETGPEENSRKSRQIEKLYRRLDSPVHGMRYWSTVRRLEHEISMCFPEWMFDMILRLQTETVQTAVSHSLDSAPEVLVRPLYQMIKTQREDPVSIQPYLEFLKEFELPEIHAVMLQLYAVNDMGREEIQEQIYAMLDQNCHLTETAYELKADSALSWMGMLAAVPMLISVIVMVVNMSLMLFSFLEEMYRL